MATRSDATLVADCSTNARFRAFAQFVEDVLVTDGGWVVTGDTGQTTPATLTFPAAGNTKQGYRVYRMADALQGTAPIFMRVDYGSGGAAATPAVWLTIGTGSDGAGAITTVRLAATQFSGNTGSTGAVTSFGSSATNRFAIAMFTAATNVGWFVLGVERTKDSNGADTTDGLVILGSGSATGGGVADFSQFVNMLSASQPATETAWTYVLSHVNPSTFSSNIGVALVIPFAGAALQPGMNFAVVRSSDFANGATFAVTVYGNARTYQQLNAGSQPKINAGSSIPGDSNARVCMRFD
jgi:hypothetical protein